MRFKTATVHVAILATLSLAACSGNSAVEESTEPVKSETQKESEAIPKSERGLIVKQVGEPAELKDADGNVAATLTVTNITVDLPCTEEFATPAVNGHLVGVDVSFESSPEFEKGALVLGPWGFKAIDDQGVTFNKDPESAASVMCIPTEQFVNRIPGPGEKIEGTIVLDVPTATGILAFADMWEWEYPAT